MKAASQVRLLALLIAGAAHLTYGSRQPQRRALGAVALQQDARGQASAGSASTVKPFYRYYNPHVHGGNHFYTTDPTEIGIVSPGCRGGYCFEFVDGSLETRQVSGSVPLYRFFDGADHFYTIVGPGNPGGFVYEKVAGYCFPYRAPGTVPLYRYVKLHGGHDHLYTTNPDEIGTTINGTCGAHHYCSEGTECYVYPSCHVTNVRGSWQGQMTVPSPTTLYFDWGTSYTHEESRTDTWSMSVSHSVSGGFEAYGFSGSVQTSVTVGVAVEKENRETWSQSRSQSVSFNFTDADRGKRVWQFVFEPSDTCGHTEQVYSKELAITEGAWMEPCCVPGWAVPLSANSRCKTADSKISNAGHCSVG